MPAQILAFLGRILVAVLGNNQLTNQLLAVLGLPAQQDTLESVLQVTQATLAEVDNVSYGLPKLRELMDDLITLQADNFNVLNTLLVGLATGTTPVTLPTEPPTGYGGASASDISDQVWNDHQPNMESTPLDALQQIARSVNTTGVFDMPLYVGIFQVARIEWNLTDIYIHDLEYPTFDPTDIGPEETLLDVLTRQNPTWSCTNSWSPQTFVSLAPGSGGIVYFTTIIDESGFTAMKRNLGLLPSSLLPSLWPGIDNVNLGGSSALGLTAELDEPMDGVIITLSGVPPGKATYTLGSQVATAHIGQIAFTAGDGLMEYPQNLSFASEIYVPHAMTQATGVKIRCVPGVTGTVQAWLRNLA